jgi:hypothetical protein
MSLAGGAFSCHVQQDGYQVGYRTRRAGKVRILAFSESQSGLHLILAASQIHDNRLTHEHRYL